MGLGLSGIDRVGRGLMEFVAHKTNQPIPFDTMICTSTFMGLNHNSISTTPE